MKVLFVHQNFPGQFVHLAASLAKDKKNQVMALTVGQRPAPAGVTVRPYTLLRTPAQDTHILLKDQEAKVLLGEACAAAALQLKSDGFEPDIIVAHPGWGEALFMKDVFPHAKLVIYCEYYYAAEGQDVGFDPEELPLSYPQQFQLRLKNTANLLSLEIADAAISPTEWQKKTYPAWAQKKISVIHDGIELDRLKYNPDARIQIQTNTSAPIQFKPGDKVVSYVARSLEPVRGFQVFMRSLPRILANSPNAHAIIVGGDEVSYGRRPPNGETWRQRLLAEVGDQMDLSRVHFVGHVPYQWYLNLLSVSCVHAYWTTPFVLSWSFLEAAVSGLPLIASATPPVEEFAHRLGVETVDFFDSNHFSKMIEGKLANSGMDRKIVNASELSVTQCVSAQKALLSAL